MLESPAKTADTRDRRLAAPDTSVLPSTAVHRALPADACLVHIHPIGPAIGRRHTLAGSAQIGREPDCPIHAGDRSVSRRHALVERRADGTHHVQDLGSTNGTFVNDERIRSSALLRDGDYLRVGNCVFRFLEGGNVEADYHAEIIRLSVLDPLTGVPNRRALDEFLGRELGGTGTLVSLLLIDLDDFKAVNDRLGHAAGDAVLRSVAGLVRGLVRPDDLFARYGGEEFAVVLVDTPLDKAVACGERIRRAVAEHPIEFGGERLSLTTSVGVAVAPSGEPGDSAALTRQADARLYEAKRSGRNRVCAQ